MSAHATIRATGLTYVREGRAILHGLDFEAPVGAVTAVTGPSGSGKSTLLAIVAGLERPDAGAVESPFDASSTSLILQAYGLVTLLTAAENVEVALQQDRGLRPAEIRARARAALDAVRLGAVADHLTESLSGGQQQRVAIARAFVTRPRLLVADEFTAELDRVSRDHVNGLVRDFVRGGGTALIATHDPDIARAADHVVTLGS